MSYNTNPFLSDVHPDAAPAIPTTAEIICFPNKLAWALEMARRNFAVFPLRENTRVPLAGSDGHLGATTDPDLIRELWTDPMTGAIRNYNIGVCPSNGRVVIIDLDVKEGRDGINAYLALGGEIAGMVVRTTTGGLHIFCLGDDLRTGAGRLAPGIDTRTVDGYVVGPGSTIDGVAYELILDEPMRPVPQFVIDKIGTRADRAARMVTTTRIESDLPHNVARAIDIAKKAEPAVSGCWHDLGYPLGCEMCRVGLSPEMTVEILHEHWVSRGTGFNSYERFVKDVLGGYHDALPQHGIYSVDAQCEAFKGLIVIPPPDEPGETDHENARDDTGSGKIPSPEDAPPPEERKPEGPVWNFINPADVDDLDIPEQEFLVPGWLAPGYVTMLYADGGIGKSLLALQLMTSLATGKPWLGIPVQQCKSIGLFCEDPQDELNRRQRSINRMMGVSRADLQGMRYTSGIGQDNTLMTVDRDGTMIGTPAYLRLGTAAREFGARLIIVDTAADTFGGNENDRREVRGFIGAMLGKMALHLNAAVLLIAQPSRDGLKSGRLDGGSTAWNNTARARWTLDYVKGDDGVIDPDERVLGKAKANYGTKGDELKIRWTSGAFVPVVPPTVAETRERWDLAETTFLMLLNRLNGQGRDVSPSKMSATTYAPKVFASLPRDDRRGLLRGDFEEAQGRLFSSGKIAEGAVASGGRTRRVIVPSY